MIERRSVPENKHYVAVKAADLDQLETEPAVYHINRTPLGTEGPFRLLVAACNRLQAEAEEYQFDDGMGRGAALDYWYEFDQALEQATEVLKDESV